MFKKILLAAAVSAVSLPALAVPGPVEFDFDGAGGVLTWQTLNNITWQPSSTLVTTVEGGAASTPDVGDIFQTYSHASFNFAQLGAFGAALGEWTFVAGFREVVTSIGAAVDGKVTANFETVSGGNNFFQIYRSAFDSNDLTGKSFNNGTLVLEGTVLPGDQTSFTRDFGKPSSALDQFGPDNYPDIDTVSGEGGGGITVEIDSVNANFLRGIAGGALLNLFFTSEFSLPYLDGGNSPSSCFWDGAAYISGPGQPNTLGGCDGNNVGTVNGDDGKYLMFQTIASSTFDTSPLPEPGSLALMGAALGALSFAARRNGKKA